MKTEIDKRKKLTLKFAAIGVFSIVILIIVYFLISLTDVLELNEQISDRVILCFGGILCFGIALVSYALLKKKRKFLILCAMINFLMALLIVSFLIGCTLAPEKAQEEVAPGPYTYARYSFPPNPTEIYSITISPRPKHQDSSYEASCKYEALPEYAEIDFCQYDLTNDRVLIGSYIYTEKAAQEESLRDYEYLLSELKKEEYEEVHISEPDLHEMEEYLIPPNEYAFFKKGNNLIFLEVSKSHWKNCYELMIYRIEETEREDAVRDVLALLEERWKAWYPE